MCGTIKIKVGVNLLKKALMTSSVKKYLRVWVKRVFAKGININTKPQTQIKTQELTQPFQNILSPFQTFKNAWNVSNSKCTTERKIEHLEDNSFRHMSK